MTSKSHWPMYIDRKGLERCGPDRQVGLAIGADGLGRRAVYVLYCSDFTAQVSPDSLKVAGKVILALPAEGRGRFLMLRNVSPVIMNTL